MIYWDTSAIIPLIIDESTSIKCNEVLANYPDHVTSFLTEVECHSAINRRIREGSISTNMFPNIISALDKILGSMTIVNMSPVITEESKRFLSSYNIRAFVSIQYS